MDFVSYLNSLRAQATGASGKRAQNKARLLDDADMNIGNAVTIIPTPLGPGNSANLRPELNPPRILNLDALSKTGQMATIVFAAALPPGGTNPQPGPITGIIEFGNGAVFSRVEVDIPIGPYSLMAGLSNQPIDGGTIVTVPAGVIRAYARHDGHFIYPSANGSAATTGPPTTSTAPVIAKALATYYTRAGFNTPKKTCYLGAGGTSNPAAAGIGAYSIPAYSKRFRLLGNIGVSTVTFRATFVDGASPGSQALQIVDFPPNVNPPFIDIPGTANAISFSVLAGAVFPDSTYLEFEIGF